MAGAVKSAQKCLTIAVSGSRSMRNADVVWPLLDERAIYYLTLGYELHWHFGEAQGVDALALLWARERQSAADRTIYFASLEMFASFQSADAREHIVPAADWRVEGYAAGPIRNGAMLRGDACPVAGCKGVDVLFAIWDGVSRGTNNTRMQARALNIPCMTYVVASGAGWVEDRTPEMLEAGA